MLENLDGSLLTPSYVLITQDNQYVVGEGAKLDTTELGNKFFDAKRLIGQPFSTKAIQRDMKSWPFKIKESSASDNDSSVFLAKTKGKTREVAPEEVSAELLRYLKRSAERKLGKKVKKAVITVPAYFTAQQTQATKDAALIAGLDVLRTMAEPTAAAVAYGMREKMKKEEKLLVFDLGGGTFDVSILEIEEDFFDVKGVGGDAHLGGQDFDNLLIEKFLQKNNLKMQELKTSELKSLRKAAEVAKVALSKETHAELAVEVQGKIRAVTVSRVEFEQSLKKFEKRIKSQLGKAVKKAGIKKEQIDKVILVGGSTRVPWVQRLVESWAGKTPDTGVDPDQAVANGAAVYAAVLSNVQSPEIDDIIVADVIPLALGIETTGGRMTTIVEANEKIPIRKTQKFSPASGNQSGVSINIFQGPYKMVKKNTRLGGFHLEGIGQNYPEIEITFDVDANGITKVTAHEKGNNKKGDATIKNAGNMSDEQKKKVMEEFEKRGKEDEIEADIVGGKQNIKSIIERVLEQNKDNEELKEKMTEIQKEAESINDFNEENVEKMKALEEKLKNIVQVAGGGEKGEEESDDDEGDEDDEDEEL